MKAILEGAGRLRTEHVPVLAIVLAVAGTVGAYVMVGSPPIVGAEDANIFFRYARNLAEGHGVVFNPGGERVEGITSLRSAREFCDRLPRPTSSMPALNLVW